MHKVISRVHNNKSVQLPYGTTEVCIKLAARASYKSRNGKRNETKRNRKPRPTMNTCIVSHCNSTIASFPGLLTPATVCRSTNAFPALVLQVTNAGVRRPTYSQLAHTETTACTTILKTAIYRGRSHALTTYA